LRHGRFHEQDIASVFPRAIQLGDTVLDIGANIGIFENKLSVIKALEAARNSSTAQPHQRASA
jgi:hypothetical protein